MNDDEDNSIGEHIGYVINDNVYFTLQCIYSKDTGYMYEEDGQTKIGKMNKKYLKTINQM